MSYLHITKTGVCGTCEQDRLPTDHKGRILIHADQDGSRCGNTDGYQASTIRRAQILAKREADRAQQAHRIADSSGQRAETKVIGQAGPEQVGDQYTDKARPLSAQAQTMTLPFAVLFVGAESQGKTTLAHATDRLLREQGVSLQDMIVEVARDVLHRKNTSLHVLRTSEEAVNSFQEAVFLRQFQEEESRGFRNYVSDRGPDNLAYMAEHGSALSKVLQAHGGKIQRYQDHCQKSLIFHVTPSLRAVEDGTRVVTPWHQIHRIDAMIKYQLSAWGVRSYQIRSSNAAERMGQIRNTLRDWCRAHGLDRIRL